MEDERIRKEMEDERFRKVHVANHIFLIPTADDRTKTRSNMSVVGIDLGLQNSLIAAAGRGGVDVILNGNSNRVNP